MNSDFLGVENRIFDKNNLICLDPIYRNKIGFLIGFVKFVLYEVPIGFLHTVVKYIPVLVLVPLYLYVLLYLKFFKNIDRYKLWLGKSFYSPFLVFTIPDK